MRVTPRLARHCVDGLHGARKVGRHIQILIGRRVLVVGAAIVQTVVVVGRRLVVIVLVLLILVLMAGRLQQLLLLVSVRRLNGTRIGRLLLLAGAGVRVSALIGTVTCQFVQSLIVVLLVRATDDRPAARRARIATVALVVVMRGVVRLGRRRRRRWRRLVIRMR